MGNIIIDVAKTESGSSSSSSSSSSPLLLLLLTFVINDGERICQMVITNYTHVEWDPVEEIDSTVRGDGGFGHTGVK